MGDAGLIAWFSLSVFVCFTVTHATNLARGWGDNMNWQTLEDGLMKAKDENKPMMVVIHKTWCGACKALKPSFAGTKEIEELSSSFIMVNLEDDEEPSDSMYNPDGGYIPRILFIDPTGSVRKEFYNEQGNPSYKYYYPKTDDIVLTMKKVQAAIEEGTFIKKEEL